MRAWLLDDSPASRFQAASGRAYRITLDLLRNPLAVTGALIIAALILTAIFADTIAPEGPGGQFLDQRLEPPSAEHWFGTDQLGRDIFARVVHGAQITLQIVALVAIISAPLGLVLGAISGYFGGWIDRGIMGVTDVFLSMPKLVLALAFAAALGPGIENAIIAIAITTWPAYARIARAETLTLRNSEFVAAARLLGASHTRIITRHVLPLCTSSMIVRVTLDMAGIILTAAGLGFLGLGAQPPQPEWGAMISGGRSFIYDQWWVSTFPGFAIILVSLGFCFLGDGLRDVLDPKSERKG
ncbi:ABC transporter permease [Gymnodinialimonas ceratoperidinii]|uniref:ABC transporter permease n=1 Tax=Gymnodinialimonas ceratoperidinii TaxID=2856823 RepID=A0A8F6TX75_9RHOB|nr:ABC transporter permease [Gymnodinialimonas ceratoperidinii]QXT40587.1 ABC transporter permease [Gymnodinialimonas ceratoperidinii]